MARTSNPRPPGTIIARSVSGGRDHISSFSIDPYGLHVSNDVTVDARGIAAPRYDRPGDIAKSLLGARVHRCA